ncbi:MAG: hypothetical protein H7Y30_15600 [Pyrinomonadaceae bacterium]|nr:hypothetical protein [Pyrinomonadaceae bacterium]
MYKAVQVLIAYRVVRPGYGWLLDAGIGDSSSFRRTTSGGSSPRRP